MVAQSHNDFVLCAISFYKTINVFSWKEKEEETFFFGKEENLFFGRK